MTWPESRSVGAETAFSEAGCGPTVVLLRGPASLAAQSQGGIPQTIFASSRPRCTVMARANSSLGPGPLIMTGQTRIVAALADCAGDPIHLIGHSYRAAVTLHSAEAYPDQLRSLVLVGPATVHLLREAGRSHATLVAEIEDLARAVAQASANETAVYGTICVPTLIACGSDSSAPLRSIAEVLITDFPQAQMVRMHGAGHMPPIPMRRWSTWP